MTNSQSVRGKMKFKLYLIALLVTLCNANLCFAKDVDADVFAKIYYERFKRMFETNHRDLVLDEMNEDMLKAEERSVKLINFPVEANARVCLKCYVTAFSFIQLKKDVKYGTDKLKSFMKRICTYGDIDNEYVCNGNVEVNFPIADFIFSNRPNLTTSYVCGKVMPEYYCVKEDDTYENALSVEKPVLNGSKAYTFETTGKLRMLQLSDFHYDQYYEPGSDAQCGEWVCCRGDKLPPDSKKARAGFWGDYHICDSPGRLAENLLQQIASLKYPIDFVYFTGDYADHFGWNMTRETIKSEIKYVFDLVKRYLPNIPVYPVLGNHEGYPANFFAPNYIEDRDLSSKWLFEFVADQWKQWLPDQARRDLATKGYYTLLVRPNLRLIALNSNVCNVDNLWIIYDGLVYQQQLLWLIDLLEKASNSGEKVHIIGHVPSNDYRCDRRWTMDIQHIIERYAHVIAGHFNGHTHIDEFIVYYSSQDKETALNVAWNGGSGTNFVGLNSNFKFYDIDDRTYEVLDFETWIFNLTEANRLPSNKPIWYKEYSFTSRFNVKDLSPSSIHELLGRFRKDKMLLRKYWETTQKESDAAFQKGCDEACLQKVLDSITRTTFPKLNIYKGSDNGRIRRISRSESEKRKAMQIRVLSPKT